MRRALSILVLIGAITLLQIHGIEFWTGRVGAIGILWSLLLEGVALWLWYQPSASRRTLGLVASLILLAGPLHQVAVPVLQEMENSKHADSARLAQISIVREKISGLEKSMETFLKNSEARTGWLKTIQESERRQTEAREELAGLLVVPAQAALGWSQLGIVLMQGGALVLFQLTAVLIIVSLSSVSRNSGPRKQQYPGGTPVETESETLEIKQETSDIPDVAQLSERLEKYLAQQKLAAREFAAMHNLNPRDISFVRNHQRRVAEGKQVAPPGAVRRLAEILESCD